MGTAVVGRPMKYSEFTTDDLVTMFGLRFSTKSLFEHVVPLEPTPILLDCIQMGLAESLSTKKARSEFLVSPILLRLRHYVGRNYSVYSGKSLNVDPERGLKGACDFILSSRPPIPDLQPPLLVIVEAKRGEVEDAMPQCAAQMVAARIYNEKHDVVAPRLHGCVTSGREWRFLRLEDQDVWIDTAFYYLTDLGKILGILAAIVKGTENP